MNDKPTIDDAVAKSLQYKQVDIFHWANTMLQYQDDLTIDLFMFNRRGVVYRTKLHKALNDQLPALFVHELLTEILTGLDEGIKVREFEDGEAEEKVLQRVRVNKVEKAVEVLNWLKTQEHEIELFVESEHDIKRIKGIVARCSHPSVEKPFYVIKVLPQGQVTKGEKAWMIRENVFVPFDAEGSLRIPPDNQLLVVDQDMFVFNQAKLESLFQYNAKVRAIAEQKITEIENSFSLSFADGLDLNSLLSGSRALIKKLQDLDVNRFTQAQIIDQSDEMGLGLMADDNGAIIIMDTKDLAIFVNLLNDDYVESNLSGLKYEIKGKRELKVKAE